MEKIAIISKCTLVLSSLVMTISFGLVAFDANYGFPLIIGEISGVIFIISDIIVVLNAILQLAKKE